MPNQSQSKHKDYYEAILQLRPAKQEFLLTVNKQLKKREAWIAKEEGLKTGANLFLSDRKCAVIIGRILKKQHKGTLKVTKTLFSRNRQTGKNIYRITVLFRAEEK